jgi:hypothetical protein
MKIAVCFHGQLRTGIENYPNIKEIFSDIYDNCDFFIHNWNFCEYKTYNVSNISKKPIIEPAEKFEIIKQLYSPKKMVVDDMHANYINVKSHGIQPLWHSFWKSVELKKQYELENNFKYDYVIKLRTDIILNYHDPIELLNEIIETKKNEFKIIDWDGFDIPKNIPLATDVFFVSKSNEMDIAANYIWFLMKQFRYNKEYINFPFYLKSENITPLQTSYIKRFSLLRDDFIKRGILKLNKSEMLKELFELERYYYSSPPVIDNNTFVGDLLIELEKRKIVLDENKNYYLEDLLKKEKLH